jgi:putative toxin-antitoxin system antitoxin component (TIGR02293 family)
MAERSQKEFYTAGGSGPVTCEPSTLADRTAARFGILVGADVRRPMDVVHLTRKGVPAATVQRLLKAGISEPDLLRFVPKSTLALRKPSHQLLQPKASDRLVRFVRVHALAVEVLGSVEKAAVWLHKPRTFFDGMSAMDMMQSDVGAQLVEEAIWQLDEGYSA